MKNILITGATGFIGESLCKFLSNFNKSIIGTFHSEKSFLKHPGIEYKFIGDISLDLNWKNILADVDCIIHCAGRSHIMSKKKNDQSKIYHSVNVKGTKQLAEHAAYTGVKRIIFLSSIKVNGEITSNDEVSNLKDCIKKKFTQKDLPAPQDAYAISKLEAENILWEISLRTGLEIVVLRLPLVYGYGVKGNLGRLIKLIESGIPLPLDMIKNQRSMIGIDNLINLIIHCIDHSEASGKTFLASDGEDLSTPELIKLIASSMRRRANLFPFPIFILKFLGSVFGRSEEINRLVGSLRIDNNYTKEILNWTPPVSVEEGIRRMVQGK